eukprot:jgi/Undpi1/5798/HiC_scaffold_2.g01072.m1
MGDMLASMFNIIGFSWDSCPAATEMEIVVLDQLGRAVGLPEEFLSDGEGGGVMQGSACEATLVGVVTARTRALKHMRRVHPGLSDYELMAKMTLYTSDQAHSSVQKAANIAGLGGNMRLITAKRGGGEADDNAYALDAADLAAAMKKDVTAGLTPIYVCATVGSTNSCAIDPVRAIGKICRSTSGKQHGEDKPAEGLVPWLHLDAAYAGSAAVCPENRWVLDGIEGADSIAFNLHKWLLVNFDCTAMWVKNKASLVDALSVKQDILYSKQHDGDQVADFKDMQVPLSRKFRSLKIWFTMRAFGLDKVREHIRRHTKLARDFEAMVKTDDRFEIVAPGRFGLACLRLKSTDAANEELRTRIVDSGLASFSSTKLGGKTCLRICVGCPNTNIGHMQELWVAMVQTTDAMEAGGF